jgi:phage terminase small subunit
MEASRKEKKLTPKQEKFAQAVASGTSLKEAAVLAGYSHKNAGRAGAFLANNEPLVQRRIQELQNRGAARATLTLSRHLDNLEELRDKALSNNAFGAAVTAEISRGKAAGIYVERKELTVNKTSDLTKLEIISRLKELHQESGGVLPSTTYTIEGEQSVDSEPEFEKTVVEESKDNSSGVI